MSRRSFFQMQPTFELHFAHSIESFTKNLRVRLQEDSHAAFAGQVVDIRVTPSERRYWSPHLTVQFEEGENGQTIAYGRYSPRPEVWTMFAGIYAIVIFCIFIGTIYAYVQWALGFSPWALIVIPAGLLLILLLHWIGFKGQQWSEHQMDDLKARFDALTSIDP